MLERRRIDFHCGSHRSYHLNWTLIVVLLLVDATVMKQVCVLEMLVGDACPQLRAGLLDPRRIETPEGSWLSMR